MLVKLSRYLQRQTYLSHATLFDDQEAEPPKKSQYTRENKGPASSPR